MEIYSSSAAIGAAIAIYSFDTSDCGGRVYHYSGSDVEKNSQQESEVCPPRYVIKHSCCI